MIFPVSAFSQKDVNSTIRLEIPVGEDDTPVSLMNCGRYGVVLAFPTMPEVKSDSLLWSFSSLDVNMEVMRQSQIMLHENMFFRGYYVDGKYLYYAFSTQGQKKENTTITIFRQNLDDGVLSWITTGTNGVYSVKAVHASSNVVLCTLSDSGGNSFILSADFFDNTATFLKLSDNGFPVYVLGISTVTNGFTVCYTEKLGEASIFKVISYKYGRMVTQYEMPTGDSLKFLSGFPLYDSLNNIRSVVGSYYTGDAKNLRNVYGLPASGIFSCNVASGKIQLYPSRTADKEIFYLWAEPVTFNEVSSVFKGEAYMPNYKVTTDVDYDFYGRPYTRYYQEFIGFKSLMAMNYVFSSEGVLLWIGNMEISHSVGTLCEPRAYFEVIGKEEILNMYFSVDHIDYKFISSEYRNDPVESFYPTKKHKKDSVVDEKNSVIDFWYDKYYLVSGYQKIKNNSLAGHNLRNVFYVQKIELE
ncbi:MAG: hypothetical protein PHR20_05590 [Bacteroidales bacterium]|nr:hypothetical protein [Bacteroidales bacterium]